MRKFALLVMTLAFVGCASSPNTADHKGPIQAPWGAWDYCERHPEADRCS